MALVATNSRHQDNQMSERGMLEFDMRKFCSGMNDIDRDLREMALFDLHRALREPNFQLSVADVDVALQCVLRCFSMDEPNEEVRNSAVQVVPILLFACNREQQKRLFLSLCDCCTPQTVQISSRRYSNIVDSSAYAIKLCCEGMSEKAREKMEMWQLLDSLAHTINDTLISKLNENIDDVVKDCIYDSINALINPFCRSYSSEVRDAMARQALLDFSSVGRLRRRVTCCLSLLAPMLSEGAFNGLREAAFGGLSAGGSKLVLLPYVQLCESLVRSSPLRVAADSLGVAKTSLKEIAQLAEHHMSQMDDEESDYDLIDAMLQFLNCMVIQYPNELSSLHIAILEQCVSLAKFDPNYCGDDAKEEEEDEVFDDYIEMEEVDVSWKVRMWAVKIISSLVLLSPFSGKLIQCLKPDIFSNVNDRVEEVQLSSLRLVDVVARHVGEKDSPSLLISNLDKLLRCLCDSNRKVCIAAARSLQLLYSLHGNLLLREVDRVHCVLKRLLHKGEDERGQMIYEIIDLIQQVIEVVLSDSRSVPMAVELFNDIFNALDARRSVKLTNRFLRSMKTMAHVAKVAGAPHAERCMTFLISLLEANSLDTETFSAALVTAGHCFTILSPLLSGKISARCLEILSSLAATNVNAVHALLTLVSQLAMVQLPPDLLGRLSGYLGNDNYPYQHEVVCVLRDALRNGSTLTSETLADVVQCLKMNKRRNINKEPLLIQATLQLLYEVSKKDSNVLVCVLNDVIPTMWKKLQELSELSSSLYVRVVESFASLLQMFFQKLPDKRSELVTCTLRHISSSQVPDIDVDLLKGISLEDTTLLENMHLFLTNDDVLLCLCAGTIGQHQPLSDAWKTRILGLLSDAATEKSQRLGLLAIGRATSNPGNASLVPVIVEHAVKKKTEERHIYWRAIKEATLVSTSRKDSSFTDVSLCKEVETRLLENVLEDDVETTAAVLGSFAPFNFDDLLDLTLRYLDEESDSLKAACISTQRYLLSYCKEAKSKTRLDAAINASLEYLKRTSGIQTRFAALQLYTTIASSTPQLLFSPKMRDVVYPSVLSELIEDPSLTLTIDLGNYTHREDKGIELRKLAFECVSILLRDSGRQSSEKILDYYGRYDELLSLLIHGCGRQAKGEVDENLNNMAKDFIVQLVKICPNLSWSDAAITNLCEKLNATLSLANDTPNAEKKKISVKRTLNCVLRISEFAPFTYATQFQPLFVSALRSPMLTESMTSAL